MKALFLTAAAVTAPVLLFLTFALFNTDRMYVTGGEHGSMVYCRSGQIVDPATGRPEIRVAAPHKPSIFDQDALAPEPPANICRR